MTNPLSTPEIQNFENDRDDTFTKKVSVYGYDDTNLEKKKITGSASGTKFALDVATNQVLKQYVFTDMDKTGDPQYYGFTDVDGKWFIMEFTADLSGRYIQGDSDYTTSWTGRAGLSYDYFYNIF